MTKQRKIGGGVTGREKVRAGMKIRKIHKTAFWKTTNF